MAIITIKINERSAAGKTFQDILDVFIKQNGVEIIEDKSPYNHEFVKKIKTAQKRGNYKEINPNDLWGSLGLK